MMIQIKMRALLLAALGGSLLMGCQRRHDPEGPTPPAAAAAGDPGSGTGDAEEDGLVLQPASVVVPDEELLDQDGAPVRLRALLEGHVVAVNFVFTTCTTVCSPMTAIFGRVQDELGPALERDARLISISLDPATDTPEALRRYADRFGRRRGWTFLTGDAERLARVRRALSGETSAKQEHRPITLVGSAAQGRWTRIFGIARAPRIAAQIQAMGPHLGLLAAEPGARAERPQSPIER